MKKYGALLKLAVWIAGVWLPAALPAAQTYYEYDWVGGQPGFSGKIFLDAPASATALHGGTAADVLPGSYLATPLGYFPLFDATLSSSFYPTVQWDATNINTMLLFFEPTNLIIHPAYDLPALGLAQTGYQGVQNGLEASVLSESGYATAFAYDDFSGTWQFTVTMGGRTLLVPAVYPTIQMAMDAASSEVSDTILVAPGVYHEGVDFENKPVHLTSLEGPGTTIIAPPTNSYGPYTFGVMFFRGETSNSVLSGFTITNGDDGVFVFGSSPTIVSNVIVGFGTGVECKSASATVRNNLITGCNDAIFLVQEAAAVVEGNVLQGNTGSGIFMASAGTPFIRNNLIQYNRGDGINLINYDVAEIIQNVIVHNGGNGIEWLVPENVPGMLVLNNTIADNGLSPFGGAGISAAGFQSNVMVLNNIIIGNPALSVGGYNTPGAPVIQFNDVFSPTGAVLAGGIVTNLDGVDGNINTNPLFACPADGDYRLVAGSPCCDVGTNTVPELPGLDYDGNPRKIAATGSGPAIVDLGAYEVNPSIPVDSCPAISGPAAIAAECQTPAAVTVLAWKPDGGGLTVVWKLDGLTVQTNLVPAGNPPTSTNLSFTVGMPIGTNLVEVTATDSLSNSASCSMVVTVADTMPPVMECSTNIAVDLESEAGAQVFFTTTATDVCTGAAAVISVPPSGSVFPIGTNLVACTAMDGYGNSAQCGFSLTVRSVRKVKEDVLAGMTALELSPASASLLHAAITNLSRSLSPNWWVDDEHLRGKDGVNVFLQEQQAVHGLQLLATNSQDSGSVAVLQGFLNRLVKVDRLLAMTEMNLVIDGRTGGHQLKAAWLNIAQGDRDATNQQYEQAIQQYQYAWRKAIVRQKNH